MREKVRALWCGLRLMCPSCEKGRIYEGLKKRTTCNACGVRFERSEEGDFLITVVAVYSTTAVMISGLVFIMNFVLHGIDLFMQMAVCLLFGVGFALVAYRNFKGLSVGLLYLTFGLKRIQGGQTAVEHAAPNDLQPKG